MGETIEIQEDGQDSQIQRMGVQLDEFSERLKEFESIMERNKRHQLLPKSVSGMSAVGTSEFYARADHVHPGVAYLTDSKGNQHTGEAPAEQNVVDDRFAPRLNASRIKGLWTFDRDPLAPFAVSANSAYVPNLDADLLDGYEGAELAALAEDEDITGQWTFTTARVQISGNTTPVDGAGLELGYGGSIAYLLSYDRDNTVYRNLYHYAQRHRFYAGAVLMLSMTVGTIAFSNYPINFGSQTLSAAASLGIDGGGWVGRAAAGARLTFPAAGGEIDVFSATLDLNSNAITKTASITMDEDGWIGIGAALERFVFDGSGGIIEVQGAHTLHVGTNQAQFRDPQIYIASLADGHLDLEADISVDVNSILELEATTSTTGHITQGGNRVFHTYGGIYNLFIGDISGNFTLTGLRNIGVGRAALLGLTDGIDNTAIGNHAMLSATGADYCSAVGSYALDSETTGQRNTAVGSQSLTASNGGSNNSAFGERSGLAVTTGDYNTMLGSLAGQSITTAHRGVFVGWAAGFYETGSDKLFIDNATRANEADGRVKALIYGVFDALTANQVLRINGHLEVLEDTLLYGDAAILGSLAVDRIESIPASPFSSIVFANQILFEADGGIPFGGLSVAGNAVETAIAVAGTFVQVTIYDTGGPFLGTDPDTAQNHIRILTAGRYWLYFQACAQTVAPGGADLFTFEVRKNNGTVIFANLRSSQMMAGGGGDQLEFTGGGYVDLDANDTVELWATNEDDTDNILITHATLGLHMVAGVG